MCAIKLLQNNNEQKEDDRAMVQFMAKLSELDDYFFVNKDDMTVGKFKSLYLDLERIFPRLPSKYRLRLEQDYSVIKEE